MVTPKIGWLVRVSQDEQDQLNQLKKDNENGWIHLRVEGNMTDSEKAAIKKRFPNARLLDRGPNI